MTTLLQGVNAVFNRLKLISGSNTELTSLSDDPRQNWIDISVQVWAEVIDQLYSEADMSLPKKQTSSTITLVTSDRDYALASDVIILLWPLHDTTNGRYIDEYPGGFNKLRVDQPYPSNETGLPQLGAIRPSDGQLYVDKIPTSAENGLVYTYHYLKDFALSSASDVLPFNNEVYRALIPAVSELQALRMNREFVQGVFDKSMGRAMRALRQEPARKSWSPHRVRNNMSDPFNG